MARRASTKDARIGWIKSLTRLLMKVGRQDRELVVDQAKRLVGLLDELNGAVSAPRQEGKGKGSSKGKQRAASRRKQDKAARPTDEPSGTNPPRVVKIKKQAAGGEGGK